MRNASPPTVATYGEIAVLYVMATEMEYGPHLKNRITPVITGVGPVEAAVGAAAALGELDRAGALPNLVCSLGTAGSAKLEHAGIYQVSSVAYRDMDASPIGFDKGVTPFADEPAVIAIRDRIPDLPAASISTGGNIVSGAAYDAIAADMVDMETYSVFRAARAFGVPMIGLRAISDGRSDLTGLHDWTEFLHILDEKLALVLDDLAGHIKEGRFRPSR
ncbi:MAG: 5'-methylthioadenosine/S-adenosylhomocysteine nucleosidase [Bauldia sp.]|nr:5'-methylthioadenosine/S-adenosylhomocysteine nucleosidase [Bauldia sp.]